MAGHGAAQPRRPQRRYRPNVVPVGGRRYASRPLSRLRGWQSRHRRQGVRAAEAFRAHRARAVRAKPFVEPAPTDWRRPVRAAASGTLVPATSAGQHSRPARRAMPQRDGLVLPPSEPHFARADRKRPAAARVVDVAELRIRKKRFGAGFALVPKPELRSQRNRVGYVVADTGIAADDQQRRFLEVRKVVQTHSHLEDTEIDGSRLKKAHAGCPVHVGADRALGPQE